MTQQALFHFLQGTVVFFDLYFNIYLQVIYFTLLDAQQFEVKIYTCFVTVFFMMLSKMSSLYNSHLNNKSLNEWGKETSLPGEPK